MQGKKEKEVYWLLPISRQENRAPLHVTLTLILILTISWEGKCCSFEQCPCFLPFLPALHAEHVAIWYGTSAGVSCPRCVASQLLVHQSLPPCEVGWEAEKALVLCKNCSAIVKTSLGFQYGFQHKSKAQPHTSYCEKTYLSQTQCNLSPIFISNAVILSWEA